MKRTVMILLALLIALLGELHPAATPQSDQEIKPLLARVTPSLVKVIAENHRRYIATGIVIEPQYVLSSLLIAGHPVERITIETIQKKQIGATIAGRDPESGVILLRISEGRLPAIRLAAGSEVGETVALIGTFYNRFPSVFQGIVSMASDEELILNAPVAPGAAGGAVVNRHGELVGVIRGKFGFSFLPNYTFRDHSSEIVITGPPGSEGDLCYAVPSLRIRRVFAALKKFGRIPRPWIGIALNGESMRIDEVSDRSPAQKAGLLPGDVLLEVDGRPLAAAGDVDRMIRLLTPGKNVTVKARRGGKILALAVGIGEARPEDNAAGSMMLRFQIPGLDPESGKVITALPEVQNRVVNMSGARQLGIDVIELTPELAGKYGVKDGAGLLISRIMREGPAEKAGLHSGDILVGAGQVKLRLLGDLRRLLETRKGGEPLAMEYFRDGQIRKASLVPDPRLSFANEMDMFRDGLIRLEEFYRTASPGASSRGAPAGARDRLQEQLDQLQSENRKALTEMKKAYEAELKRLREEIEKLKSRKKEPGQK